MLVPSDDVCPHPCEDVTLWRYLDFTKFMALLETRRIPLPRASLFEDPYEGYWAPAGIREVRSKLESLGEIASSDNAFETMLRRAEKTRDRMFVSCWCASPHESAALWKLYVEAKEGVAVRTTWSRLAAAAEASPLRVRAATIKYLDYEQDSVPFGNVFSPYAHKRMSFAHEHELRLLVWGEDHVNKRLLTRGSMVASIEVDLDQLVDSIHIAPTSAGWFAELVTDVVRRYGQRAPIVVSNLYAKPKP